MYVVEMVWKRAANMEFYFILGLDWIEMRMDGTIATSPVLAVLPIERLFKVYSFLQLVRYM